jgi:mRNA-degrading endonuclease YafQ of YafQ-DinJ toxin-antitoxin module
MKVVQTNFFKKALKKLHAKQKADLDKAVEVIMKDPDIGQSRIGDLSGALAYKFKMVTQPTLPAYIYHGQTITLTLLALGTHENFYRDLKKSV